MKIKIKNLIILVSSLIIFLFNLDIVDAANMNETTIDGSTFIQYISTCSNADVRYNEILNQGNNKTTDWKKMKDDFTYETIKIDADAVKNYYKKNGGTGNFIFSERSIIYPVDLKEVKTIYIFWHGLGWYEHTTQQMCNGTASENKQQVPYTSFCKRSAEMGDSVIIAPHTLNVGSASQNYSTNEMKCLLDEIKTILTSKGIKYDNAGIIISGHSGGGAVIQKNLKDTSWTGNNKILAALFFDATYSGWGTSALNLSKNVPFFIYYSASGAPKQYNPQTDTKYSEWQEAQDTKIKKPDQVKILETKNTSHDAVVNQCFLDHRDGKGCTGGSFIPLNYKDGKGFTNNFETIGGGAVVTPVNNSSNYTTQSTEINLTNELKTLITKPQLQIRIPGLNFKDGVSLIKEDGNIYLQSSFFQQYLVSVYKYSVIAISILAVIMIMVAGVQWLISGGSYDKINLAKKRIGGSIIGIILAVGSYTILNVINPNLTGFRPLQTKYLSGEGELDDDTNDPNVSPGTTDYSLSNITITGDFSQNVYPVTKNSFSRQQNNFGQARNSNGNLRCHAGVDIFTKPPGIIVSATNGIVTYITTQFMKPGMCQGTEAETTWQNADSSLQYGMAGGIMIYDQTNNLSYWYGEINEPSILEFINKYKNQLTCSTENRTKEINDILNDLKTSQAKKNAAKNTETIKQRCYPKNGETIAIKTGDMLGVASRCGMLHFEVYKGKQKSSLGLDWKPADEKFPNKNTANYCLENNLNSNKPPTLINAQELLDKLKSNMVVSQ